MRRMTWTILAALLVAFAVLPATGLPGCIANAAPMTYTGNLDIGEMMDEAEGVWDFDNQDAVILLEGVRYSWTADSRLVEEHHRVVWISTEYGIEHYADLRIPYDSARQELKVNALRVWRDNRWIEARETAVVPTTPYAFRTAPAYTDIRETMLLHDGVELPCVLEASWVIEDREAFRGGFEGQYVFPQGDPALNSWLIVEATAGTPLNVQGFNGAPAVSNELPGGEPLGQVFSYRMQRVEPAPMPATNDPAAYLPHVQFSSFSSWNNLGNMIKGEFLTKAMMTNDLRDSVNVLLEDAETMVEKAHRIADFVDSHMRYIGYDGTWFLPRVRRAGHTYESGYGVAVDLSVLTAALMQEAGFEVWPVLLSEGYGNIDQGVPTLARFQTPGVWVSGPGVEAYFDPSSGTLHNGLAPIYNRTVWLPGYDEKPVLRWSGDGQGSRVMASFDLSWCPKKEHWVGSGYYEAGGGYSPYDQMEGGGDNAPSYLKQVAAGVFAGADVSDYSPMSFDRFTVATDLDVTVPAAERDGLGRLPVVVGAPAGGLLGSLPHYVPLYLAERGTPVPLPGAGEQMVKLKLNTAGFDVVHLPDPVSVSNEAGSFELTVEQNGDVVTLTRYTSLAKSSYTADEWPLLRDLLLAEENRAHRTILLQ